MVLDSVKSTEQFHMNKNRVREDTSVDMNAAAVTHTFTLRRNITQSSCCLLRCVDVNPCEQFMKERQLHHMWSHLLPSKTH